MKKLILATLTVAALTGFAYFQNSVGGTCTRTDCDGPQKIAADTCSYTGCQDLIATTCNGSDADCSDPKITASIIIHCSETSTFGGCIDSNSLQNEEIDATVASIIIHCSQTSTFGHCVDSNAIQNTEPAATLIVASVAEAPCGDPLCCGGNNSADFIQS